MNQTMNPRNHALLPLAAIAGLALSASAGAATVIASFTTNTPSVRAAAYDPGLDNLNTGWTQTTADAGTSYTFRYDISGLGIGGGADELLITVATIGGTETLNPASGNGIAVNGGLNNIHWDPSDPGLNFTVVVEDAGNNDITNTLSIDLTGVAMRWGVGAAATFAGQSITQSVTLQGVDLANGQTAETSFTATRTGTTSLTQVQQLRFDIAAVPEPSVALILSFATLPLLRRRRSA
jgi:hypothetical protein